MAGSRYLIDFVHHAPQLEQATAMEVTKLCFGFRLLQKQQNSNA
jgi:hypothetical protein